MEAYNYEELLCRFFDGLKKEYNKLHKDSYQDKLKKFFKDLSFRHRVIKEVGERNKVLALGFNLMELIAPDENKVSDLIALLLNPKGTHGQGDKFLQRFLELIKKSLMESSELIKGAIFEKLIDYTNLMDSIIMRGLPITEEKRVDITIGLPNGLIIGIENNLSAEKQEDQLKDYDKFLDEISSGNYLIIYLDGWGRKSKSIDDERKFKLKADGKLLETSYHGFLKPWLRECFKVCEADKVRWFLRDFIIWIEKNFKKEVFEDE